MKKVTFLALLLAASVAFAQEETKSTPLEISGSVDTYYKYDFSKKENNIKTSFATDQNSASLGMIDIALKKTSGKASFVGEISFGPRGQQQSILDSDGTIDNKSNSFHIQNLYVNYAVSDKFTLTAGYMATFIGYEVISPVSNFHYSTSYLFTNGPFQNAGIKGTYKISSKVALMAGAFNDSWNAYQANSEKGLNAVGAQLSYTPNDKFSGYLNFLDGSVNGTIVDLTASYQVTDAFKLGFNAADFSGITEDAGFTGVAIYPSVSLTKTFGLGLRAEYFMAKEKAATAGFSGVTADESVTAFTLSGNYKHGDFTLIPEFRLDNGSASQFLKSNGAGTKSASQATIAAVYKF